MTARFTDVVMTGTLTAASNALPAQGRTSILVQDANVVFPVPWGDLRVWDAYATVLPSSASADDLGLVGGTFASAAPMVTAGDCKAAGAVTRYARFMAVVPECYEATQTFSIVATAGMLTTVSDTTCTIDFQAYRVDKTGATIGSDLVTTTATNMNSLTFAAKTFNLTASGLAAGDVLDVRVAIACNDAATGTAVTPAISALDVVCDIRG